MCRLVYRILRDKDVCEDVVQELFAKLWEKRSSLSIQGSLKSYLYRSALNAALNHVSSKRVKTRSSLNDLLVEPTGGATPVELNQANDFYDAFQKALQELPEGCREIFVLSRYEQLTYKEIAETLDISPKTVENQMGKALRVLREKLGTFLQVCMALFFLTKW